MAMPGVRTALTPAQRERLVKRGLEPSLHERASIYLLLVEVLAKTSKLLEAPEANKVGRGFIGTLGQLRRQTLLPTSAGTLLSVQVSCQSDCTWPPGRCNTTVHSWYLEGAHWM